MIRVVKDSVAGKRCLVFYKDDKPIFSLWDFEGAAYRAANGFHFRGLDEELDKLLDTMDALGLSFEQIAVAAEVFCEERNKEK